MSDNERRNEDEVRNVRKERRLKLKVQILEMMRRLAIFVDERKRMVIIAVVVVLINLLIVLVCVIPICSSLRSTKEENAELNQKLETVTADLEAIKAENAETEKAETNKEKSSTAEKTKTEAKEEKATRTESVNPTSTTTKTDTTKRNEVSSTKTEEVDNTKKYADGVLAAKEMSNLRSEMKKLYKGQIVSQEEMQVYVDNYLNLIALSYANEKISQDAIHNYNNSFKGISFINYDSYELSSNEDFLRGFKEALRVFAYNQMVTYYHENGNISDEANEAYHQIGDSITYSTKEDDLKKIVEAGERVLKVVGEPEKLMMEGEWRKFKSINDLDKI